MLYDVEKLALVLRKEAESCEYHPLLSSQMAAVRVAVWEALRLEDPEFDPYGGWLTLARPRSVEERTAAQV